MPEAATYELSSCYNVSIDCRSGDMVARIQTSKLFNGKIYAKGSPNSCVQDVQNSLEFELHMPYDNLECNVRKNGLGRYVNDVVIQHHDKIVTSSDLGLAVTCQYDLTNKSVTNEVDLGVHGDIQPALSEEVTVDSPNVAMKITDRNGGDVMPSAEVGDPLALRFEILDPNSPYEIFVRELVAMDGVDSSEIVLIDSDGCPTDHFIMGPLYKSANSGKVSLQLHHVRNETERTHYSRGYCNVSYVYVFSFIWCIWTYQFRIFFTVTVTCDRFTSKFLHLYPIISKLKGFFFFLIDFAVSFRRLQIPFI